MGNNGAATDRWLHFDQVGSVMWQTNEAGQNGGSPRQADAGGKPSSMWDRVTGSWNQRPSRWWPVALVLLAAASLLTWSHGHEYWGRFLKLCVGLLTGVWIMRFSAYMASRGEPISERTKLLVFGAIWIWVFIEGLLGL